MSAAMQELLAILDLEQLEHNLYRGRSPKLDWQRVFGGQTIAQALVAAQRTVEPDRHVHSLHGYFMRPGDTKVPIVYEVDRIRDGGSFTTRRVVAIQHGQAIFSLEASFQVDEDGLEHQVPMPSDIPPPDTLLRQQELIAKFGDAGARRHPALLGARPADRDEAGDPRALYQPREAEAAPEHLDPHHRSGAGRPRHARRRCSPTSPT